MSNRMSWLVGVGALLLAVGCGPIEDERTEVPVLDDAPTEDGTVHATGLVNCTNECREESIQCIADCKLTLTDPLPLMICFNACAGELADCNLDCVN
ncbi:hypothetical protein SAMN05443572_102601 [Myxococcus fulvus]|uniref:Lipoprotein n=1 Tax=Myxococcus fulvus TaxID=33 RepID=A0A511SYQ0_MYXFU|nr:hypothetical protein [Myxococcus fulvus]GEN06288.1 hypothetical protein MFU01_13250 [Myxococcus fulvus]SET53186.1 hypothetical protein SAMN05443572_102601 [Myxococcus fulvus]